MLKKYKELQAGIKSHKQTIKAITMLTINKILRNTLHKEIPFYINDIYIPSNQYIAGFKELKDYENFKNITAKEIIDMGANIGIVSKYLSKTHPSAKIYAFEPHPTTYKILLKNTNKNIKTYNYAIGTKTTTTYFYETTTHLGFSYKKRPNTTSKIKIKQINVNEIFETITKTNNIAIKYDIEGYEYEVFKHIKPKHYKKITFMVGEYHEDLTEKPLKEFLKILEQQGFQNKVKKIQPYRYIIESTKTQ